MEGKSMAKSLSDSKIFSLRIVSIDYYMAPPIPNIDICYSSFQGGKVNEVPVIRVYGSTPAGQKTCLHVHRAFPYLYVPCSDIPLKLVQEGDSYTNAIALALEKALKLKSNAASKRQHVHGCSLVRARKFYGYHSSEELFVKIYLYYPNDVSRAANLLLAGAVLDKSLQPHESHIPYLLQFLIDYNLYGMGHVHLSKIKFRHPVPDVCMPRKFNCNSQHALEICTSADFEAGSSGSKSLDSPIWVSYTIPGDWMWQFSSEYETLSDQCIDHIKRQSICELEGDAIVDEILNQQCKTYTPLSQTSSDVKMVQSLIPIWEEEYERTGVHEAVILPVPGKPLAEDVLRTLSHDLEFQRKCMEFYCISEENLLSIGNNVKYQKSLMSSTSKEDLAEIGNVNSDNNNEEPLKSSAEKDIIGSSSSFGSLHAEEMDAAPPKKKDACPELLCLSDVQSSEIIGTLNPKIADAEALGLLRWLATSQAAEDINSDDELVRETILSPLLPATTIDKVLEKANIDYESESQKECQDILDSVEDLTDFESLKDKAFHSTDTNRDQTPSKIPQGDAVLSSTSTSSGSSSKVEMKSDFKRHFEQQVIQSNRSCISNNGKRKKSLWGSLPFSPTEKGTDHRESTRSHIADAHGGEGKNSVSTSMAGNEEGKHSDAQAKNSDVNVCGVGDLVWCSVRDLMRKKRCCRIVHQNCGNAGVKIVRSGKENEQDNIHLPNKFDLHAPHDDKHAKIPLGCVNFSSCSTNKQIKYPEVHVSGFDHPHCHIYMEAPYASSRDSPLQDENCYATKHEGDSGFSLLDSSIPAVASMEGGPGGLISMIFSKKPPIMDWKNRASEKASFSPALLFHPSFVNEDKHGTSGNALDEILPFFEGESQENIVFQNTYLPDSDSNVQQEAIIGVPTHYQNDGSLLFLLTPVYSPPSSNSVYRWLACDNKGTPQEIDMLSVEPLSIKGSSETGPQGSSPVCGDNISMESGSVSHLIPMQDQSQQDIRQNVDSELHPKHDKVQRLLNGKENNAKLYAGSDCSVDLSQISGPNGSSRPTPLSQIGFRDPASIGAGQQLTLLSIEVLAESRGDLRPDPRFDAINVVALAFQNDNDSAVEVYVLLHGNTESCRRNSDGISVNKVHYFSDEKHLFSHFIGIMSSYDPDIIIGWDIQGGSLGFLAERAAHIGMGFLNKISRTPIELNIGYIETEISNKGALDSVLHESSLADSVLVEQAIIEDEWGRTHASGVHVGGRVVLNLWRLMRSEVKLNMYTIGAVGEAVLRRKIPSIPHKVLTRWFSSGPGRARYRCIEYIIQQAKLNLEIINHLDMINRTSELARVFGIDFFSVLSRGSQYRVESMFLRLAHSQNYLAISPGKQQVASQPAMECLPLVMEPESGFYADPVVVLDFQSLYPSMIIAYNLCFSTCLGNVARWKENSLGVCSFSPEQHVLRDLKDKFLLTPNSILYVPPKVRKGILPRLLEEILSTRIMVKKAMKKLTPAQQVLHRIFNARQLALKLIANVTYGYTAAGFSGRMPCAELADSIVQCGRSTLEKAISLVNANDKWNARVIYGDTDSMFVLLKGRSVKESFQIGHEIASAVTAMNPDPVTLKMEKVYHPCFLLTKKRYVGYSYESVEQTEPVFDAKGIETVRRDTCGAVAKMMEQSLRLFFERQDISEIKGYLQRQWTRILSGRVSLQDFVFAKEVRLGTYSARTSSSLPPAAIVATKAMRADPRAEPCYAERVPYVVIHGEPGAHLFDMVVDPLDLLAIDSPYRLNDIYYINKQIIPALQRVFGLLGVDLKQWFLEMPRPGRDAFSKRPSCALNPQRTRIDFYYLSKHCMLCGELVHASTHICKNCSEKETAAATAVIGRTSKLEKEMQHLSAICRHCGGGDWILESGVKCISLACSVFYERRKVQKELQGLSYVAADKGFHPKCMVEWF